MQTLQRLLFLAIVSTQSCLFSITESWPQFGHDKVNTANTVTDSGIFSRNVSDLVPLWDVQGNSISAQPVISSDNIVYYTDFSGQLYARNASTGSLIWSIQLNQPGTTGLCTPQLNGNVLYIGSGSDSTAYAIDRSTGQIIWSTQLDTNTFANITSSPNSAEGLVFFATDSNEITQPGPYTFRGAVYALHASTGNIKWKFVPSQGSGPGVAIRSSSPALDTERGLLFIGTGSATDFPAGGLSDALIALNYRTNNPNGELVWSYQFTANDVYSFDHQNGRNVDVLATPHVFNVANKELVGVASKAGSFAAFDRATGQLEWERKLIPDQFVNAIVNNSSGATIIAEIDDEDCEEGDGEIPGKTKAIIVLSAYDPNQVLDGPKLMAGLLGNLPAVQNVVRAITNDLFCRVTALKARNGKVLWTREFNGTGSQALTATNNVVFVFGYNGFLRALKANNGKTKWELVNPIVNIFGVQARLPFSVGPTISDGRIYFGTGLQTVAGGISAYTLP